MSEENLTKRDYDMVGTMTQRSCAHVVRTCAVSGNPCGTDTHAVGYSCKCLPCQLYLRDRDSACSELFHDAISLIERLQQAERQQAVIIANSVAKTRLLEAEAIIECQQRALAAAEKIREDIDKLYHGDHPSSECVVCANAAAYDRAVENMGRE